ncbi:hypothetical protein KEJ26_04455 [Candidatus Bathyarchaeota archaeon]|nr:hypothetical protein [Candidatus Bathyarchaeota archaeon]
MGTNVDFASKAEDKKPERKAWVSNFEIKGVLPCFTTPGYIRIVAQADNSLDDIIPILALKYPPGKVEYHEELNELTLKIYNRLINFFPSGKITMTNTKDLDEARTVLEEMKNMINEAYDDFLKHGKPKSEDLQAIKRLTWINLYKYLPRTNCGICGYQTCMAFTMNVLQGNAKLSQCTPLGDQKYSTNVEEIKRILGPYLLQSLGWK